MDLTLEMPKKMTILSKKALGDRGRRLWGVPSTKKVLQIWLGTLEICSHWLWGCMPLSPCTWEVQTRRWGDQANLGFILRSWFKQREREKKRKILLILVELGSRESMTWKLNCVVQSEAWRQRWDLNKSCPFYWLCFVSQETESCLSFFLCFM